MNNDRDHIPEDSDPAYDNPVGKLPERVKQPFDLDTTLLHSEYEREQIDKELAESIMPEVRTREMKKSLQWLEALRKRLAAARSNQRYAKDEKKIEYLETEMDMLNECAIVWAAEVSLFLKDLRLELANHIESNYPDCSRDLARALREDTL
mgnify:CR=1 FL=1